MNLCVLSSNNSNTSLLVDILGELFHWYLTEYAHLYNTFKYIRNRIMSVVFQNSDVISDYGILHF